MWAGTSAFQYARARTPAQCSTGETSRLLKELSLVVGLQKSTHNGALY